MLLYLISHLNYHTVNSKSSIALEHSTYHTRTELILQVVFLYNSKITQCILNMSLACSVCNYFLLSNIYTYNYYALYSV